MGAFIDTMSSNFAAWSQSLAAGVTNAAKEMEYGVSTVSIHVTVLAKSFVRDANKLLGSTEGIDMSARLTSDSIQLSDLIVRGERVARPIIKALDTFRGFISSTRIFSSLQHLVSGGLYRDIANVDVLSIISETAFLLGRTLSLSTWLLEMGIGRIEAVELFFANIAASVGNVPVLDSLISMPKGPFIDAVFAIALIPLTVKNVQNIVQGRDVGYNALELASLAADVALCALGVFSVTNPLLMASLGIFAAGTGIVAFFNNPANTSVKDPLAK